MDDGEIGADRRRGRLLLVRVSFDAFVINSTFRVWADHAVNSVSVEVSLNDMILSAKRAEEWLLSAQVGHHLVNCVLLLYN